MLAIPVILLAAPVLCLPAAADATSLQDARSLAAQAQIKDDRGDHDDAIVDLTRAILMRVLPPAEQARLLFDRGLILDAQGRLTDAAGDYSAAILLAPRFAAAFNNRANVYRRQNRLGEAKRDYRASLATGDTQPEYPWYGLGQVAEAEGNIAGARDYYAKALAANPGYGAAADRLAAIGGKAPSPEGQAGSEPEMIHLRPPGQAVAGEVAPIILKPPRAVRRAIRSAAPGPSPIAAVENGKDIRLRPALDSAPSNQAQIQLGAWRSEQEATEGWASAHRRADGLLDGLSPHIVAADLPGRGRYYRLRAGPVRGTAAKLCAVLAAKNLDCMPAPR